MSNRFLPCSSIFAAFAFSLGMLAWTGAATDEPEYRPALVGNGPASLVNLIDVQKLLRDGAPDGAVMFSRGVFPPGKGRDFTDIYGSTPGSRSVQNEVLRALNRSRFLPAIAHHKAVPVYFRGTVLFFARTQPHLRVLANQNPDALVHFEDFVAPQEIIGTARWDENDPRLEAITRKNKSSVVTLELHVNERGKLLSTRVLSEEPRGYNIGAFERDMLSTAEFVPGFRQSKPCDCSFQMTRAIGLEHYFGPGSR
ncbi:MAG: hypothetical protein H0T83_04200 [Chthoniobacterales bacterium]|nr:hypothetical protein [Chthoniobacterales bacterium]